MVDTKPPALMVKVPLMVEADPKFIPPAISTSLKMIVPEIVPVPANETLPEPRVKVLVPFANVPPAAMFNVPPSVITTEPLLVTVVAVKEPLAPKVSDFVLLIVTEEGTLVAVLLTVTAWLIVTVEPATGTALPNQVVVVFQSVAALEIYPKLVYDSVLVALPP